MGKTSIFRTVGEELCRLRHFRGHGVHSPYVYKIVREVFMRRTLFSRVDAELLLELAELSTDIRLSRRVAVELHNLFVHCGYSSFAVNPDSIESQEYVIVTKNVAATVEQARKSGTTVVIVGCRGEIDSLKIVANHPSTSVMKRDYTVLFNNNLPKQNFTL